jgi:8-oxo-dGTP pyrophosphatase MutT (NUDIX family)
MEELLRIFPAHRLPPGFLSSLDNPPHPPRKPRPAATLCLLREGPRGLEALLLRRSPRAGFIPGAFVFPGGTVDPEDASPEILARLSGVTPAEAQEILGACDGEAPPAPAYWVAALRETFEETGILFGARTAAGEPSAPDPGRTADLREGLLAGKLAFVDVMRELGAELDAGALTYVGHWITPECEPRRYDTRFFAARMTGEPPVTLNEAELAEALWLTPSEALDRNREGSLPLVFPTLRTLEDLQAFGTPEEALEALAGRPVPRRLPTLVRTAGGIGIAVGSQGS